MAKVKVMIIGLGYWGPNLLRAMGNVETAHVEIVSDCSIRNIENIAKSNPGVVATPDYRCGLDAVDAVMIATPPDTHHDIARTCLEFGKHVFVEKPLTPSIEQAGDLLELSDNLGLTLMVGHIYRFSPAIEQIKQLIDRGVIGKPLYISSSRANMGRFSTKTNVVWDLLPHDLSIIHHVLSTEITEVSCRGMALATQGICDVAYIMVKTSCGIIGHIHNSWYSPERIRRFEVIGTDGSLVLDESSGAVLRRIGKGVRVSADGFEYFDTGSEEYALEQGEPLVLECRHFIDCISTGARPRSDANDGIRVLKTIIAAQKSLERDGTWVYV